MAQRNVRVGNISDVSGEVTIATGDIYKGFTIEQVSLLIQQITTTFEPKKFDGRSPYKGLEVFEEEDTELFFGREKIVDDLVTRVKASRMVFITGPSGSGKSSLVRAGLLPTLKTGALFNSDRWLYATMNPGRDPFEALGNAFSRLKSPELGDYFQQNIAKPEILHKCAEATLTERSDQRLVLFIDQFEEVFTQLSATKAETFINTLAHAATFENGRVILLFTMRSDFISNCATYPKLNALLNQQFVQIGAMQPDELVSAISQPALRVGLKIDPDLIAQIINDMEGEPGTLPLMQFALKDLFDAEQTRGGIIALTLSDYIQRGGIRKSLERHANDSLAKLNEHEQELARSIFTRLIEPGRGTVDTRRTELLEELILDNTKTEEMKAIIRKLADARLVTTDEVTGKDTVTISHEKLIEAWPWLKKLVDENRDVIKLQNEIAADAKEWDEHERGASYLYSGARLGSISEQLQANRLVLSEMALEYLGSGQARQKRNRFAFTGGMAAIISLLVLAVIIFRTQAGHSAQLAQENGKIAQTAQAASTRAIAQQATAQAASTLAVERAEDAQKQTRFARSGELSAQVVSLRNLHFQLSLLLGIEVYERLVTVQSLGALIDNVQAHPQLAVYLNGHTSSVTSVAFSPDGKTLASGSEDNTIVLWNVQNGRPLGQPLIGHTNSVNSVTFSPDGKTLASGSDDSTIILWDVATGQATERLLAGHVVDTVVFSPDGKTLASGGGEAILLWRIASHQSIGQPLIVHTASVTSMAFSPDGKTLASAGRDNTILLWNVETGQVIGQPLTGHTNWVNSVTFSPDGRTLASGSDDGTIILWDVAMGQAIGQPLIGHTSSVTSAAFSPDGKTLASGNKDDTIILWDVAIGQPIGQPLTGHTALVNSVAFSPDSKTLASGSGDNTIILWNITTDQSIGRRLTGHKDRVNSVTFSPDGRTLASGSQDGTIILWDIVTGKTIGQPLIGHVVDIVAFSPDGKTLASGNQDDTIILWDVASDQAIGRPFIGNTNWVESLAFSPDGKTVASGSWDNPIILWNVETGQAIGQPVGHKNWVNSLAFSPDGKTLASGSGDKTIILWNVETGQAIGQPLTGYTVDSLAFSPDGKTLASGGGEAIILWSVASHQPIGQPLTGHTALVNSVAFSPDGRTLASGSRDGNVILWDIATGKAIGQPFIGHTSSVTSVTFSPDGKTLASGSWDNTIILWDVNPQSWINKSCERVGRNLTHAEWEQYFPDEAYHQSCEQFSVDP